MPKPKECANCQKPATIHLTQIIQNKVVKLDFCEDCTYKQQVLGQSDFPLGDFISPLIQSSPKDTVYPGLQCGNCGLTQKEFQKIGRLGCPHCYNAFRVILNPVIKSVQAGDSHLGKNPKQSPSQDPAPSISPLEKALQEAIDAERYEDAAVIRDQINEMEGKKSS